MMRAGGEDKVINALKRAGTLDSDGYPIDASPGARQKADLAAKNEEEKKEWCLYSYFEETMFCVLLTMQTFLLNSEVYKILQVYSLGTYCYSN